MTMVNVNVKFDGPKAIIAQEYKYQTSKLLLEISLTDGKRLLDFAAKDEICAHQWIDLSQPDYGVALLNDCKYGFKAYGNVLDINLLRSPSFPDPVVDCAQPEFSYSIFPYAADYIQAEVYKQGYEANVPLRVAVVSVTSVTSVTPVIQQTVQLEKAYSFVKLSQANIMIEAVKKAVDSEDLIIRLYETVGASSNTKLSFGKAYSAFYLTDLMENNVSHLAVDTSEISLSFRPFEIKTLRLQQ